MKAIIIGLLMPVVALAQEVGPLDGAIGIMEKINQAVSDHGGMIGGGISMILLIVSKLVSTEKAGPVVHVIQVVIDGIAKLVLVAGGILQKIAEMLAKAIQSDGTLGKK
jgi:hypothetical protein